MMGGFGALALGSLGDPLAETFEEVAREVEAKRLAEEAARAAEEPAEAPAAPVETVDSGSAKITVASREADTVRISVEGRPPPVGAEVSFVIAVVTNEYGADVESELEMGEATVKEVTAESVTVELTETSPAAEGFGPFEAYSTLTMRW